jgi:hypothetical protein
VRGELEAIASAQRRMPGSFQPVVQIFGTPAWAAERPAGCDQPGFGAFSRAPSARGLVAYRGLIRELLALAARVGVSLPWWSPWNEPNSPRFLSPQRAACSSSAPTVAPLAYAKLVRAAAAELRDAGGQHELLLGELAGYESDTPDRTSIAGFVSALPADVLCAGAVWTVHVYALRAAPLPPEDPARALESALDQRGGCAAGVGVWVTEAGTGAPHPGRARGASPGEAVAGCVALAEQLRRWLLDERIRAVFQFTFREDPAFPVGLVTADLIHTYPAYGMLATWSQRRTERREAPDPAGCV